ncbi:Ubiquitin carboxyl-terminal hydrolase CYLD, partial [Ophiophagus hannah]
MDTPVMHSSYQPTQLDRNMYYILTENYHYGSKLFHAGSMCFLREQTYLQHISRASTRMWRFIMEQDGSVATVDVESLQPVNEKMADFLLAINNAQERLNCFLDRQVLDAAMTAKPASETDQVEEKRQKTDGIVPVKMGDTVGFYLEDAFTRGIVLEVYQKGNQWMVNVCPEEEGSADVFREIPLDSVDYLKHKRSESSVNSEDKASSLDVNSVVQINLDKGRAVTGTIRWIGCLPNAQQRVAGIELSNSPPLRAEVAVNVLRGRMRGIQGHCNSCYMDAALFSLFSCTSVLDSMLYKPSLPADGRIQEILRDKIVNPLRQNGFVAAKSVMDLRYQLTEKGESSSFATSEKDPEEFLNLIMHRILGLEPLLKLQEREKVSAADCCLRTSGPRECFVCGDIATQECSACFKDKMFAGTGLKQFCDSCCSQAHSHYQRRGHQTAKLHVPKEFARDRMRVPREKLELFAVLCIETSHYVSFVKYGPEKENWMFFDSMADRHGDENGYNIPTVTLCPEVAKYLEMPVSSLAMEQPRDMEGVAKRLFCDAYMYMYQSKKMALYK